MKPIENEPANDSAPQTMEYRLRELQSNLEQRMDRLERVPVREGARRWIGPLLGALALVTVPEV